MIELLHSVEVIAELLDDPALLSGDLVASGTRQRSGVGIIEAPRGTLIHDYDVADDDLVTRCNLIVSTTHNNQAMNEAVRSVAAVCARAWVQLKASSAPRCSNRSPSRPPARTRLTW